MARYYATGTFEPSAYSAGYGQATFAVPNPVARPNVRIGAVNLVPGAERTRIALTKDAKYNKADDMTRDYWQQYQKCKGRRTKNGMLTYPCSDYSKKRREGFSKKERKQCSSTGLFATNCSGYHKKWKKWEAKRKEAARDYEDKLKNQEKLTGAMQDQLAYAQAAPLFDSERDFYDYLDAQEKEVCRRRKCSVDEEGNPKFTRGSQPGSPERAAAISAGFEESVLEEEAGGFPLWLLGIGAAAALGGVGYYVWSTMGEEE